MKNNTIFLFFLVFLYWLQILFAQDSNKISVSAQDLKSQEVNSTEKKTKNTEDTVSFVFKYMRVILISEFKTAQEMREDWIATHRKRPAKYIGLGIGGSGFLSADGKKFTAENEAFRLDYSKSVNVQLNFFAYKFRLTNHFGLTTGLGFNFDHFVFLKKDHDFIFTQAGLELQPLLSLPNTKEYQFKKYSLNTVDLHVPLLFEWAPMKKRFRIATGFTVAWMFSRELVRKYEDPDLGWIRQTRRDGINFNPFQIYTTTEIGYRFLSIYFDYGMLNLFENSPYHKVHPFRMGLRINP